MRSDLVPVEPLRRRFEELRDQRGIRLADVARALDWTTHGRDADGGRVSRYLGLTAARVGSGKRRDPRKRLHRQTVAPETAVRLAEALDLDPREIGL
jgi:hypothetical protein